MLVKTNKFVFPLFTLVSPCTPQLAEQDDHSDVYLQAAEEEVFKKASKAFSLQELLCIPGSSAPKSSMKLFSSSMTEQEGGLEALTFGRLITSAWGKLLFGMYVIKLT